MCLSVCLCTCFSSCVSSSLQDELTFIQWNRERDGGREGEGGGWEGREREEAFEWLSSSAPWVVWFPMATKFGQAARLAWCLHK